MEQGNADPTNAPPTGQRTINMIIAGFVGQIGCLTFIIILGSVFAGLWLDGHFNSKPSFTIGLVLVSIPVSLFLSLLIARKTISKIKNIPTQSKKTEETSIGKDT